MHECTHEDVRKIVETSLWNVPSSIRWPQKNPLATDEERCHAETEMDSLEKENEGLENNNRNKQWRFIKLSQLISF